MHLLCCQWFGGELQKADMFDDPSITSCSEMEVSVADLLIAVMDDSKESVKKLLEAGANVNGLGPVYPGTPLLQATQNGNHECVDLLLEAGADVNKANSQNITPLIYAAYCDWYKLVEKFIGAGADVNAVDNEGRTALIAATKLEVSRPILDEHLELSRIKSVKLILQAGAHINTASEEVCNALQFFSSRPLKDRDLKMLLYAAGEKIRWVNDFEQKRKEARENHSRDWREIRVPKYMRFTDIRLRLLHICREAIRNHLLEIDPHTPHLFERVPKLDQLPVSLREFLLYDLSLEIYEDDDSIYCSSEADGWDSPNEGFHIGDTTDDENRRKSDDDDDDDIDDDYNDDDVDDADDDDA